MTLACHNHPIIGLHLKTLLINDDPLPFLTNFPMLVVPAFVLFVRAFSSFSSAADGCFVVAHSPRLDSDLYLPYQSFPQWVSQQEGYK